jgi:hypothetical protein
VCVHFNNIKIDFERIESDLYLAYRTINFIQNQVLMQNIPKPILMLEIHPKKQSNISKSNEIKQMN